MQAELTDGRIIDLDGYCECGCSTTFARGPCWIRADRYAKAENRKFLDRLIADEERIIEEATTCTDMNRLQELLSEKNLIEASLARFAEMEIVRLREKRRQMEQAGIVRLITDAAPDNGGGHEGAG